MFAWPTSPPVFPLGQVHVPRNMFTVYTTRDSFSLGTSYCIEDVGLIKLTSMLLAVGTNRELHT